MNIEEVRKAAAEFSVSVKEFTERQMTSEELVNHHINERVLARWAVDELARREAERAERAKPIDDEWFYAVTRGRKDIGPQCRDTGDLVVRESLVKAIKTRGQLLDLLAALKGGET